MDIELTARVGGIFALLVLVHFIADWVFQSHAEAMAKPRDWKVRAKHCLIYTVLCCAIIYPFRGDWLILAVSAVLLFFSHFLEDTYIPVFIWARLIRKPGPMDNLDDFVTFAETSLGKILLIVIDQLVHLVFLLPVAVMIVCPHTIYLCGWIGLVGIYGLWSLVDVGAPFLKPTWKLWVDDQLDEGLPARQTPSGYLGAKSSLDAVNLVRAKGLPKYMDLDFDLGGDDTVMIFLKWLESNHPDGPVPEYRIHSENVEGRKTIESFLNSWKRSLTL